MKKSVLQLIYRGVFIITIIGLFALIADFGFDQYSQVQRVFNAFYIVVLLGGLTTTVLRYIYREKRIAFKVVAFDVLTTLIVIPVLIEHFTGGGRGFLYQDNPLKVVILLNFIREFSEQRISFKRALINPAQLFILSFTVVIFVGALLLCLPNASNQDLHFLDALFTSTSAVCVTGLIVVDTATHFTTFGQTIILLLIQVGGLGILTFASYFSYFFKGGSSYENQLVIGEMTNSQKLGEVFSTLKKILGITAIIEITGAVLIFFTVDAGLFPSIEAKGFFAIFHSVSAFCNAGFSTFTNGLYELGVRFNYPFQLTIVALLIFGGLGFPIISNVVGYVHYRFKKWINRFLFVPTPHKTWVLNMTSRITLATTIILLVVGTLLYMALEYDNTLAEHKGYLAKLFVAFFNAATPRTAGFNNVDMAAISFPAVMVIILLMWIGASPSSTGGGIKTSTFAIAMLNIISIAKGKTRVEIFRREIADVSVKRAFATIALSLLVIGLGVCLLAVFDSGESLRDIAFECFSAYSTVGLSIGLTAKLSAESKLVIITMMFIGRVGMLSILIAFFRQTKHKNYRYPSEELMIN